MWWLALAAVNTVVSMGYYWRVIRVVMMHTDEGLAPLPVPWASRATLLLTSLAVLGLGLFPGSIMHWAYVAVAALF